MKCNSKIHQKILTWVLNRSNETRFYCKSKHLKHTYLRALKKNSGVARIDVTPVFWLVTLASYFEVWKTIKWTPYRRKGILTSHKSIMKSTEQRGAVALVFTASVSWIYGVEQNTLIAVRRSWACRCSVEMFSQI